MAENKNLRPLKEFSLSSNEEPHLIIVNPAITANNFELKPTLLQIVQQNQFIGLPIENPNQYLKVFIQLADTLKCNNGTYEAIRLCLFPFSLKDKARSWLDSLPANSITTWNDLKKVFLARYFPPGKTIILHNQITIFTQQEGESLFDAWERYKELLRACPYHALEQWLITHTFYNRILYNTKMTIDAAVDGALMSKPYPEACALIEDMAQNHYQWGTEHVQVEKKETKGGIYEVSNFDHTNAKMDALTQEVKSLVINPIATVAAVRLGCEICGTPGYVTPECSLLAETNPNQAKYAQVNPYSNTYNVGWRNHPNFSYKNNNPTFSQNSTPQRPAGFQAQRPSQPMQTTPHKSNLKKIMEDFITRQA
ncbi:uncharacterized protein LOC127129945 [Lathyrus oleraceus]|uniref:uncharacterized protein LOC127129945 n=1 Tax=Pisum sativum TaxID=3888 RepID=UPI0021D3288D|nr:uncharacterized protein LOC127129945 [Pisum sativum]